MPRIKGTHTMGFQPAPRAVGTTTGINRQPDPLAMLSTRPLDGSVQTGVTVLITGSGWAEIDAQWWPVQVVDRLLAQFRLMGADTTGAVGTGAGATVFVR